MERHPLLLSAGGPGAGIPCRRSAALSGRPAASGGSSGTSVAWRAAATGRLSVPRSLSAAAVRPGPDLRPDQPVEIISHFPLLPPLPWRPGWRVSYYIDATLHQNFVDYGLAGRISRKVREEALRREPRITTRPSGSSACRAGPPVRSWSITGFHSSKVHAILPGCEPSQNSDVGSSTDQAEAADRSSSLRLGFIGKDWRRKGLPFPVAGGRGARAPKGRRARGGAWPARGGSAPHILCWNAQASSTSSAMRGASCSSCARATSAVSSLRWKPAASPVSSVLAARRAGPGQPGRRHS